MTVWQKSHWRTTDCMRLPRTSGSHCTQTCSSSFWSHLQLWLSLKLRQVNWNDLPHVPDAWTATEPVEPWPKLAVKQLGRASFTETATNTAPAQAWASPRAASVDAGVSIRQPQPQQPQHPNHLHKQEGWWSAGLPPLYLPLSTAAVFCLYLAHSGLFRAVLGRADTLTAGSEIVGYQIS